MGNINWMSVEDQPVPDIGKYLIRYEYEGTVFFEVFNSVGGNLFWDYIVDGEENVEMDRDVVKITHWANINEPQE